MCIHNSWAVNTLTVDDTMFAHFIFNFNFNFLPYQKNKTKHNQPLTLETPIPPPSRY